MKSNLFEFILILECFKGKTLTFIYRLINYQKVNYGLEKKKKTKENKKI